MDLRFNPDTNPYADDLLRLARAPGSRYTPRERQAMAAVLAGRLYGLHYRGLDFFYRRYQHAFVAPQHRHVAILTWFDDGASPAPGLFEHPGHDAWLIVLAVGDYGVAEAFNGAWTASTPDAVVAAVARLRAGEFQADARSDMAIERRSDDDARREYLGGDSGADEPRERPTRHDRHIGEGGGGGGDGRGGGGGTGGGETGGGARPGGGGAAEVVNHPVLFSVDAMTFDAILALT